VALTVVLTLALGIGANVAIFTVVDSVLLRPLAYRDAGRLVALFTHDVRRNTLRNPSSPADFLEWRRQSETLEGLTAAHPWSPVLTGRGQPEPIPALKATSGLFDLLGARASLGRAFAAESSGDTHVVVLSDRLWRSRFGADPAIVGQSLVLDGEPYTVAGVMPPGFEFPPFWATGAQIWVPLELTAEDESNHAAFLRVFARLRSGVTLADARADLDVVAARLAAARPDSRPDFAVNVEALREPVVSAARPALIALLGAVGLVLLIACANVASLLLAQGSSRQREVAVRVAVGADRRRLVTHLLAETVGLAGLGGAFGLGVASVAISVLRRIGPEGLPRLAEIGMDGRVVAFAVLLSLLTGIVSGLVPALRGSRVDVVTALKAGSRTGGGPGGPIHDLLVVGEFALTLVLLAGAGLMTRSVLKLLAPEPGFEASGLLTARVSMSASPVGEPERQGPFFEALLDRVRAVPGVDAVAIVNNVPIAGDTWSASFALEGQPYDPEDPPSAVFRVASVDYLKAMGMTLRRGPGFDAKTPAVAQEVLVNESFARRYFAGGEALGRRVRPGRGGAESPWLRIAGVFADTRQEGLTKPVRPEVVFPYANNPTPWHWETTLLVRTRRAPLSVADDVKRQVWAIDPTLPVTRIRPMSAVLEDDAASDRTGALLIGLFAAVALALASVGIYGVMAYAVSRRTAEIGIRMALGAPARRVFVDVVGRGLLLGGAGAAVGLLGAVLISRVLEGPLSGLLFEVSPTDPLTLGAVCALLLAVGAVACLVPARRAATVDPLVALRQD